MCCILEIIMAALGVVTLARGTVKLTRRRIVTGAPARWIGLILLSPLPFGFATISMLGVRGPVRAADRLMAVDALMTLSALTLACILGLIFAREVERKAPQPESSFSPNIEELPPVDPDNPYAPPRTEGRPPR